MNATNLIEDLRLLSPSSPAVWYVPVLVLILGLVFFFLLRLRRLKSALTAGPHSQSCPPPWDQALSELEALIPLLHRESSRPYAVASSAVLRRFIEARFNLHAPALATPEFLQAATRSAQLPSRHCDALSRFLETCDLLKFGRYLASDTELMSLHAAAVEFVIASQAETGATDPAHQPP